MPAETAADSWIDMSAVRDKEMREEFVSTACGYRSTVHLGSLGGSLDMRSSCVENRKLVRWCSRLVFKALSQQQQ